jgi:hypothetical protein
MNKVTLNANLLEKFSKKLTELEHILVDWEQVGPSKKRKDTEDNYYRIKDELRDIFEVVIFFERNSEIIPEDLRLKYLLILTQGAGQATAGSEFSANPLPIELYM